LLAYRPIMCPAAPSLSRPLPMKCPGRHPRLPPSPYAATWANVGACRGQSESFPAQLRPRRLCGLSGGPAGPGACGAGPPPASGGFSLVRALRPRSCPRFLARFRPRLPLSPPSRAAQGGRDHAPVPRSRTARVSRGALSVVGTTYEGRCPSRLSRSCMPLRSLFTRSRSVREILRPEVIWLPIEAVAAAWL
jgi:hypothetical protein